MKTPPTDDPICIAWAWFFIVLFFIDFAMMMVACFYFPKIQKPWFAKLWKNPYIRIFYAWIGLVIAYGSWMLGSMYVYGFKALHYMLGLENVPWK